jgi:hypothetical protein
MRKLLLALMATLLFAPVTKAQFGLKTKADIDAFKDSRLIVVLFDDSSYSASIKAAVERYWNFTGAFEFVHDSDMKAYSRKPEYSFLTFARSKKSRKIKAKLCSTEDDFNGLIITTTYKKRSKVEDIIANAYCSNNIDTIDWYAEMVRGVQILNNYFVYAIQAKNDKDISPNGMMNNYPADLTTISNKKLIYEDLLLEMKGKEDPTEILGMDVEEVGRKDINKAILTQDPDIIYVYSVCNEKYCDKIFVSAYNSEVLHFTSDAADQRKVDAKNLKGFRQRIDKANR